MTADGTGRRRSWLVMALAGMATVVAAWLLSASVHIVGWEDSRPLRVVVLPTPIRLVLSVSVVSVLMAAGISLWTKRWQVSTLATILSPLLLLFVLAIPYLPWLPAQFPLLMAAAGPLRWVIVLGSVCGCVVLALSLSGWLTSMTWLPGRRAIFLVSLAIFIGLGIHVKTVQGLGGDEPHYLVITHSLLADQDLQIENNHIEEHYASFYSGQLPPHFLRRGLDRVIYSIHAPGLPALLLPAYATAGHWGAILFVALLAALAALAVFDLAEHLTSRPTAVITWAATALTVPFALLSWSIYPEMPAALIMAWSALWLWKPSPLRTRVWFWRGLVISLLPWLHMKFSLLLACVVCWLLIRLWPNIRHAAAFLIPLIVSGVLWLSSFYMMYGTYDPTVVYGYNAGADLQLSYIPRGGLGLFFDQEYGLLTYSPSYILSALGLFVMLRQRDQWWRAGILIFTCGLFVASVTRYYMWWGGTSEPARFIVPLLPLLAPMVAVGIERCRGSAGRGVAALFVLLSLGVFTTVVFDPAVRLNFNDRDGTGRLIEIIQSGVALTDVLPTFIQPDWVVQLPVLSNWLIAGALALILALIVGWQKATLSAAFWSGASCLVCFGLVGSILNAGILPPELQIISARQGRQAMITAYDRPLSTFSYQDRRLLSDPELFQKGTLVDSFIGFQGEVVDPVLETGRLSGPYALPPGQYEVRVWLKAVGGSGELWVAHHRGPKVLLRQPVGSLNPVVMMLDLPLGLNAVWVGASDADTAQTVLKIEVEPREVMPVRRRPEIREIQSVESSGDVSGRYVFHLTSDTFVEPDGFWVRGGGDAALMLSPAGGTSIDIAIQNGASAGPVMVEIRGQPESLMLRAWETRRFHVPLDGQEKVLVPVTISPMNGFRPSEYDPMSQDKRWLGCWVRVTFSDSSTTSLPRGQ